MERWRNIPFYFLVAVAFLGMIMRSAYFIEIPLAFDHVLHAHSHVGFQGWIYLMLFFLLSRMFLKEKQRRKSLYSLQFILTVGVLVLMGFAFLWQGYGPLSIALSTLFQGLNYWFIIRFLSDLKSVKKDFNSRAVRFVRMGLWLGVISTLAPYYVGYLSAVGLKGSEVYQAALYFFFHFQYNGWFLFVGIGLLIRALERAGWSSETKGEKWFYGGLSIGVFPAYFSSLLGFHFPDWVYHIALLGVAMQLISLAFGIPFMVQFTRFTSTLNSLPKTFLRLFGWFFLTKFILQGLSLVPSLQELAFHNRFMVLAYMHAVLLGVLSSLLIGLFFTLRESAVSSVAHWGSKLLIVGVLSSELFLVLAALIPNNYFGLLWWSSAIMTIGIILLAFGRTKVKGSC